MREWCMNARAQMFRCHGGAYRDVQVRHQLMQCIQNRRGLSDMAKTVAGDGDDEMARAIHDKDSRAKLVSSTGIASPALLSGSVRPVAIRAMPPTADALPLLLAQQ